MDKHQQVYKTGQTDLEELGAAAGEEEDGEARLLQAEQRGAVGVKRAENDLAARALLQDHLRMWMGKVAAKCMKWCSALTFAGSPE